MSTRIFRLLLLLMFTSVVILSGCSDAEQLGSENHPTIPTKAEGNLGSDPKQNFEEYGSCFGDLDPEKPIMYSSVRECLISKKFSANGKLEEDPGYAVEFAKRLKTENNWIEIERCYVQNYFTCEFSFKRGDVERLVVYTDGDCEDTSDHCDLPVRGFLQ